MINLQRIPRIHPHSIFLDTISYGNALFVFPGPFIPKKNKTTTLLHSSIDLYRDLKKGTPSLIQHSFATHLLETEASTRLIQTLLGHGNFKTKEIYAHISKKSLANSKSPLDQLIENQSTNDETVTPINI